jgi:suppressor of G2 allele of SKP1
LFLYLKGKKPKSPCLASRAYHNPKSEIRNPDQHRTSTMAQQALSTADSLAIDGLHSQATEWYTVAICHSDNRHNPSNSSDTPAERLTLHFLSLSHRSAAHLALKQYKAAYNDARTALKLTDWNRYDFSVDKSGKKLHPAQLAVVHHRAAQSLLALEDTKDVKSHWENAITLAALGEEEELVKMYQDCLAGLSAAVEDEKCVVKEEDDVPVIEVVEKQKPTAAANPKPKAASKPLSATTNSKAPTYQYYQDSNYMKIQILEPNQNDSSCLVSITPTSLSVTITKNGTVHHLIHGELYENILPEQSRTIYKADKVLIKLKKVQEGEWHTLLNDKKKIEPSTNIKATTSTQNSQIPRPYASPKDWNAINRTLTEQEASEKPEGEEALNALFKQIYANANEDTRRAMVKSMQTSGGTVLSTNWEEVEKADYEKERVAPKGMEWKNYEGDKLRMKEDD